MSRFQVLIVFRRAFAILIGLFAIVAFAPAFANAQLCTVTAGSASYTIPAASHYDTTQTSNFTGVGAGDYLFEVVSCVGGHSGVILPRTFDNDMCRLKWNHHLDERRIAWIIQRDKYAQPHERGGRSGRTHADDVGYEPVGGQPADHQFVPRRGL